MFERILKIKSILEREEISLESGTRKHFIYHEIKLCKLRKY